MSPAAFVEIVQAMVARRAVPEHVRQSIKTLLESSPPKRSGAS